MYLYETELIEREMFWYLTVCKQKKNTYSKLNSLKENFDLIE